jgi:hypothetical protein
MACKELANTLTLLGFQVEFCLYQNVVPANPVDELPLLRLSGAMAMRVCACVLLLLRLTYGNKP